MLLQVNQNGYAMIELYRDRLYIKMPAHQPGSFISKAFGSNEL